MCDGGHLCPRLYQCIAGSHDLFVAVALFIDGWHYFGGAPLAALASVSENYAATYNPDSSLYFDFFLRLFKWLCGDLALMLQPHISPRFCIYKVSETHEPFC